MIHRTAGKRKLCEAYRARGVEIQTQCVGHQAGDVYVHLKSDRSSTLDGDGKWRAGERDISRCRRADLADRIVDAVADRCAALVENGELRIGQIYRDALVRSRWNGRSGQKCGVRFELLYFNP